MLKTDLLPHQITTKEFVLSKKYIFDLSVPGSGKTLSSLAAIVATKSKAIIVCPPHLINNWLSEIEKHTSLRGCPHYLKFNTEFDVYVVPYTKVDKAEDIFKNVTFAVLDEVHYLKSMDSKRTRNTHEMLYKYPPEYLTMLTGTVLKNRVSELFSPLILLGLGKSTYPKILDRYPSFYLFCCRFTNVKNTPFGTQFSGSKNVEELRTYLLPYSIKHKEDVLNLPELSETKVIVEYKDDPELMKAFEAFQDKGVGANIVAKTKSAEAVAPFTAEFVASLIDQDAGPIIVFSDHRKPIEIIELELSKKRVRSITGDTPMERRAEYIKMLNSGQLDALLCSIGAASSGYTMTGAATIVLNDPPFVPGDLDQLKKRVHRISQTRPCRLIYIVGSSVTGRIIDMLNSKIRTINKVMRGL